MQNFEKKARLTGEKLLEYRDLAAEVRALPFDNVEWHQGNQVKSVIPGQISVIRAHRYNEATRVIRLHMVRLDTKVADLEKELNDRLPMLIVSVCLVKAQQRCKQKQFGFQAIVEFGSLMDAANAKIVLEDDYDPDFVTDVRIFTPPFYTSLGLFC